MDKVGLDGGDSDQKINFCLKWSKGVQMGPKGFQMVKNTWFDHLGPFSTLLNHFDNPAIFGPKWTIFWSSPVMNGGPQSKKRLITRSPMCGMLVEPQSVPFGTYIWLQSMKKDKMSNFYEKMAVFAIILP